MSEEYGQEDGRPKQPQPDKAIRKVISILDRARSQHLDKIRGSKKDVKAMTEALQEVDAELGYAAWQVGVLKSQVHKQREARKHTETQLVRALDKSSKHEQNEQS